MKELSIEEKAKRYDDAIKRLEDIKTGKCEKTFMFTEGLFDYLFPELKESEDEKIRQTLIHIVKGACNKYGIKYQGKEIGEEKLLAYLEKQGEHANFRNKIQIGDKVTRNEEGVLINLSQLKRVAKKNEKQDEQRKEWSEEDLISLGYLATFVDENGDSFYGQNKPNVVKWIRSFANRTPTKKQVWSEEAEKTIDEATKYLKEYVAFVRGGNSKQYILDLIDRIESIKDVYAWKPSEEQMYILNWVANIFLNQNSLVEQNVSNKLQTLYNDLKKLM